MQIVLNEFDEQGDTTVLKITGVVAVSVVVDTKYASALKELSWCYEQSKREVYATDPTMKWSALLNLTSPRVYLWKMIAYLHTGNIIKSWRGRPIRDYRICNGVFIREVFDQQTS